MANEIQKVENGVVTPEKLFQEFYPSSQFAKILNGKVATQKIKSNPFAGNSLYLPISEVEMQLDETFCGLWQTKNFRWQVVANEIIGTIDLHVFHPIIKDWIVRTGTGAAMIQQDAYKKDEDGNHVLRKNDKTGKMEKVKINPLPSDVDYKIKNTLVKDFPHLKAECIKNAAKSLGKLFGRDLNRKESAGDYEDAVGKVSKSAQKKPLNEVHFTNALQLVQEGKKNGEAIKAMFDLTQEQTKLINQAIAANESK